MALPVPKLRCLANKLHDTAYECGRVAYRRSHGAHGVHREAHGRCDISYRLRSLAHRRSDASYQFHGVDCGLCFHIHSIHHQSNEIRDISYRLCGISHKRSIHSCRKFLQSNKVLSVIETKNVRFHGKGCVSQEWHSRCVSFRHGTL